MSLLRRIPLPILALALGTACLGNLLASYSETIRTACTLVAAAIVLLVLLRVALDFR
ncbi:C4-dicarboxylate ABC transporter, partial [bacterium]|nr:C4-dicarboxylate ABC transporter [bacterium]